MSTGFSQDKDATGEQNQANKKTTKDKSFHRSLSFLKGETRSCDPSIIFDEMRGHLT